MTVVTISNELGSQGSLVGELAARALGYHLADQATLETLLKDYGLVEFHEEYRSMPGFWDRFDAEKQERRETFLEMLDRSLQALASHGDVVIVGRGGFAVLAGLADVLNVRIQAPLAKRIQRAEDQSLGSEPGPAEGAVKEYDQLQKDFVETVYGVPWDDSKSFDLVIDTGRITPELAASLITQAVKALPRAAEGAAAAAGLAVDKVLATTVREVLKCQAEHA